MQSEFKNQLTHKEIIKGIFIYINRKLLIYMLLLMVVVFTFSFSSNNNLFLAVLVSICAVIIAEFSLIFIHKQQFSTDKIATYKLYNDCLEIVNSIGDSYIYKYNHIRVIETKDIIVLCLPKVSFAIIAKRHMNAEQIKMLTTKQTKMTLTEIVKRK